MTAAGYEQYQTEISDKLLKNNWSVSTAESIAQSIVDYVRFDPGGSWSMPTTTGRYITTKRGTLRDFLKALDDMPAGVSTANKEELRELLKKFRTTTAIESVNAFCEKHGVEVKLVKRKNIFKRAFTPYANDLKSLVNKVKENYKRIKQQGVITLSNLKTKLIQYSSFTAFAKMVIMFFGALNLGDSEVTLGILPLGGMGIDSPVCVTDIDVSHSNKIVKYRAVGSIYLAHQVGGKDSVKISGTLQGDMRLWYLTALWILTLLSQGHWKVLDWDEGAMSADSLRDGIGKLLPTQEVDGVITQQPAYERHVTFPVVTEHEIITNCYIETFSFEERLVNGRDRINYDLMLRTYVEPKSFITDAKKSKFRIATQETKTEQVLKYYLNFTYRLLKERKETLLNIDTNNWKVKNYYDIDSADIAFVMILSMGGVF